MVAGGADGDPCGIFTLLFDLSGSFCPICVGMHPLKNQFFSRAQVGAQFSEAPLTLGVFVPGLGRGLGVSELNVLYTYSMLLFYWVLETQWR